MSPGTVHDEARAALAALALGALDGEERARTLAHLERCAACRAELAELRATAGVLGSAGPETPMDPAAIARVRARLLARAWADRAWTERIDAVPAGADGVGRPFVLPMPIAPRPEPAAERRRGGRAGWMAAAAALVLLIGAAAWAMSLRGRMDGLRGEMAAARGERARLERALAEREATLAAVAAPAVRVIELASSAQAQPGGRMFWDPRTDRWTFFAHDLPAVRAGRAYQLWMITPGNRPIPGATFLPGSSGEARVEATYALPSDSLQAVAVTEEPAEGAAAPSGPIVIAGAFASGG